MYLVHYLPHTDDGIGDENEQNDKRLNKGSDSLFTLLKPGQDLKTHTKRYISTWYILLFVLFRIPYSSVYNR